MKFWGKKELIEKPVDLEHESFTKPTIVFLIGAGASKDAGFPICNDLKSPEYIEPHLAHFSAGARDAFLWMVEQNENFEILLAKTMELNDPDRVSGLLSFYEELFLKTETQAFSDYNNCSYMFDMIYRQVQVTCHMDFQLVLISFNHDLILERTSRRRGLQYNYGSLTNKLYCIKDLYPNLDDPGYDYTILKLHGSFNMLSCDSCDKILSWSDYTWQWKSANCLACGSGTINPLYIPPTPFKNYNPLSDSWLDARSALCRAQGIYVMGYSMPEYDHHAIALLENANPDALLFVIDKYAMDTARRYSRFPPSRKMLYSATAKEYCDGFTSGTLDHSKYSSFS